MENTKEKASRKVGELLEKNLERSGFIKVVRCRYCKNWEDDWQPESVEEGRHFCPMIERFPDGNFYCADGDRK